MSDIFGIEQGVRGALNIYMQSSRGTGRTLSMVNSLKDGDRVVFTNSNEAKRVQNLCKERGIDGVDFIVVSPSTPERIFERGTSRGRTLFDHSWVEQFYLNVIEHAAKDVNHLQTQSSGFGEEHIKTKHKAKELSKWMI